MTKYISPEQQSNALSHLYGVELHNFWIFLAHYDIEMEQIPTFLILILKKKVLHHCSEWLKVLTYLVPQNQLSERVIAND